MQTAGASQTNRRPSKPPVCNPDFALRATALYGLISPAPTPSAYSWHSLRRCGHLPPAPPGQSPWRLGGFAQRHQPLSPASPYRSAPGAASCWLRRCQGSGQAERPAEAAGLDRSERINPNVTRPSNAANGHAVQCATHRVPPTREYGLRPCIAQKLQIHLNEVGQQSWRSQT